MMVWHADPAKPRRTMRRATIPGRPPRPGTRHPARRGRPAEPSVSPSPAAPRPAGRSSRITLPCGHADKHIAPRQPACQHRRVAPQWREPDQTGVYAKRIAGGGWAAARGNAENVIRLLDGLRRSHRDRPWAARGAGARARFSASTSVVAWGTSAMYL